MGIGTGSVVGDFDRDQAREVLYELLGAPDEFMGLSTGLDALLDALAGCVRPAAIDRDALAWRISDVLMRVYDNGTSPNARREAEEVVKAIEEALPALVRPVAGVTLTPDDGTLDWARNEARESAAFRAAQARQARAFDVLSARLEAAANA